MDIVELKGFKALGLKDELDESISKEESLTKIPLDEIIQSPLQPRKYFSNDEIAELAKSIAEQGVIQPIVVRLSNSKYELVAGERRWRASKLAGLESIPAIVRELSDKQVRFIALIENVQREDLNPIEQAKAYKDLIECYDFTHEQLAKEIGKSRTTITNLLRLLTLPEEVISLIALKSIEMGHARAILSLEVKQQIDLAKQISTNRLSVRETEEKVRNFLNQNGMTERKQTRLAEDISEYKTVLENVFSHQVNLKKTMRGEFSLNLRFESEEKFEQFIQKMGGGNEKE